MQYIHDQKSFQKDSITANAKRYQFPVAGAVEYFLWDLELTCQLQKYEPNLILKGGAAVQLHLPIDYQRGSIDIDIVSPQKKTGIAEMLSSMQANLDAVRFSEFKPKHPKENLNMITYHAFAKSALRKRNLRVEIDFLMENIDLPTVEVDKVPTFATTSEKIRCYTPDVLIGDKILTLARGSIGSQKIDDYPKQIYDLSMLISSSKCTNFAEVIQAVRVLTKIEAQIFRVQVTPDRAIEDVIGFIDDDLATLDLPNANSEIRKSIESFEAYYSPRKHTATREGWSTRSLKIRFVAELVKSVLVGNETSDDALRNLSRASEAAARLATLEGEKIRETRRQLFTFAQEKLPRELEGSSLERVFWEVARPENIDKLTSVPS